MKIFDRFGLTYFDTETSQTGINRDVPLLQLIALTHPERYVQINDKNAFLADITQVNQLLQEIYLRDNELRWQASEHIAEIDRLVDGMPHLAPSPQPLSREVDLMAFPGTNGILMASIAVTARNAISNGAHIKNIAVLGCEQVWKTEWVKEVKTLFELRPDLLKKGINLEAIDFDKSYTEHEVNVLISQLVDFGDPSIHFEFLPVPMKTLKDGKVVKPNTDDEAIVLHKYYQKLREETGKKPIAAIVATKGFHVRQSYSYLGAGISNIEVLMSDPCILGEMPSESLRSLVNPSTRTKLDNLAKTIYQTLQVVKILYPALSEAQQIETPKSSDNLFSFHHSLRTPGNSRNSELPGVSQPPQGLPALTT